ncbi:hypothetical protein M1439_01250 [Candidatus Marsarchaeota archaeon]|jgi:hypothetical protein|nr:hypothetical protein [Candidatus Marsarchaeota archaeon]MCL5092677.1 hypothetical protein [Candidatus Marsarchaeota archaeon]
MAETETVALVDLDGTLLFTEKSEGLAAKEITGHKLKRNAIRKLDKQIKHAIYTLAQSKYAGAAILNEAMKKRLAHMDSSHIVILTARHSDMRRHTIAVLKKHGIRYGTLICRSGKARNLADEEWKLGVLNRYAKMYGYVEFYDDKSDNLAYIYEHIDKPNILLMKVSNSSIKHFVRSRK